MQKYSASTRKFCDASADIESASDQRLLSTTGSFPEPTPRKLAGVDTNALTGHTRCYRFGQGAEVVTLRINTRSEVLQWLTTWTGHRCGVFITTHNPLGVRQSQEANDDAHARLAAELKERGMDAIEGEGVGTDGAWPAEKSFFVFGVDLETVRMKLCECLAFATGRTPSYG